MNNLRDYMLKLRDYMLKLRDSLTRWIKDQVELFLNFIRYGSGFDL